MAGHRPGPIILALAGALALTTATASASPLKVFILAGQSNMEGKARVALLDHQSKDPEIRELLPGLEKKGAAWAPRDDVFIKFLDRHGPLAPGYGSPDRIGPELAFGIAMGDHYGEPVLLIKTAWGGKSLYRDFRPPSSGIPGKPTLDALLEKTRKKKPETTPEEIEQSFGHYYRLMHEDIAATLKNLGKLFPELRGADPEIAGFFWFQGFNDMINQTAVDEYQGHMENFIRDVRKDLESPALPFVIGVLGVGGPEDNANERKNQFKKAQAAPAKLPEFKGNVLAFPTDALWDMEADAIFKAGWKENKEAWEKVGSDRPYHYLGSLRCYSRIGNTAAKALINLEK